MPAQAANNFELFAIENSNVISQVMTEGDVVAVMWCNA